MPRISENIRINTAMQAVQVNGAQLSRLCGVDRTLITRFQSGERRITRRSSQVRPIAEALLRLDTGGALRELLAPYMQQGEDPISAMQEYLMGEDLLALAPRTAAPTRQCRGEYVKQIRVFMGAAGLRRAALAMLDYVLTLPPGRSLILLCHSHYDWLLEDIPFALQLLSRLHKATARNTLLTILTRPEYAPGDTAAFATSWLLTQLHGYVHIRHYAGDPPAHIRFLASIPGYWSAHAEEDQEVEDGLYLEMHTDPRDIRQDERACQAFLQQSVPAAQYAFFTSPAGTEQFPQQWQPGPLPRQGADDTGSVPDGSFLSICRVPSFGLIRQDEYREILGKRTAPALPDYLFPAAIAFGPGPYKLILCREDIQKGFLKQRVQHDALSALLGCRAFVSRDAFRAQMRRILVAMAREDFEVALVPQVAFEKLQLELICWEKSACVAWLQDCSQSMFARDKTVSSAIYAGVGFIWDRLLANWKRKSLVRAQLRKWLDGRDLDAQFQDSKIVEHWTALP